MKLILIFALSLFSLCSAEENIPGNGVTYELSGGRFGDNLIAYMHAKWISYKYGFSLFYRPFEYSNQLVLHELETICDAKSINHFKKLISVRSEDLLQQTESASTLYEITFFTESVHELKNQGFNCYIPVDWEDEGFRAILKKMISPLNSSVAGQPLPNERITVAVHVREGGGYDSHDSYKYWPTKFPPHSFYIKEIKKLSKLLNDKPMYVHIFTDYRKPKEFVEMYKKALKRDNIKFGCRQTKNSHKNNILEDFFAMAKYDCLIRPESNFSIAAEKIGDHKIVIFPTHAILKGNDLKIDKVKTKYRNN